VVGTPPPGSGHLPTAKVFSYFFPFGCSLVSEGAGRAGIDSTGRQKMKILGHICAGQTLFLTFSVFKASLVVGGCQCQRVSTAFPAWKGDGCMKDTNHLSRHGSRHPEGDAKLLRAWRLRVARHSVWTRAKHRDGLERPTFRHLSVAKRPLGSLQPYTKSRSVHCPHACPNSVRNT
jgi:hypothetical protein